MSDFEDLSAKDLNEQLLVLQKERDKLEKDLSKSLSSCNPPILNQRAHDDAETNTLLAGKALLDRMGAKATVMKMKGDKDGEVKVYRFSNWHRGELKGQASVKILEKSKGFSIVQHTIPAQVCSLLENKKLPLSFKNEEQIDIISKIRKCVLAYHNRYNQFQDFVGKYPQLRFVWSSNCCTAELIIPIEAEKSFKVIISLDYAETEYLPRTVDCSFSTEDLDDEVTESFVKNLKTLEQEYLLDACTKVFFTDEDVL